MTAIVPQAVVTDYRLSINSCHAISRLYQATLMSCGTAKHVSVDCTIYIYMKLLLCNQIQTLKGYNMDRGIKTSIDVALVSEFQKAKYAELKYFFP